MVQVPNAGRLAMRAEHGAERQFRVPNAPSSSPNFSPDTFRVGCQPSHATTPSRAASGTTRVRSRPPKPLRGGSERAQDSSFVTFPANRRTRCQVRRVPSFFVASGWLTIWRGKGVCRKLWTYSTPCAPGGPRRTASRADRPGSGAFLGNYPQAFSHIGVIASGYYLGRLLRARR